MTLAAALLFLHLVAVIVWVGGMFTMLHAVRPAAVAVLEPPQRVPMMVGALDRFLRAVWIAMPLALATGFARLAQSGFAQAPRAWHWMGLAGVAMAAVFVLVWFGPFRAMRAHAAAQRWSAAAAAGERLRRLVAVNLGLGLATVAIATLGLRL